MIGFIIYLVGCVLCYRQSRMNFLEIDKKWTTGYMLACIAMSLGSWLMYILVAHVYNKEVEDTPLKKWLQKDLIPKEKKDKDE